MAGADEATDFHRGGCLCPSHEIRITSRCLTEDLQMAAATFFADACQHPIVQALVAKRSHEPEGGATVGPRAGEDTLYTLRHSDDHRGATWFDREHGVVWLCAYGHHRSGQSDDAFQHFSSLIDSDTIYPELVDIRALELDREQRFNDLVPNQASSACTDAVTSPGVTIHCLIGHPLSRVVSARLIAQVIDDIAEVSIAFDALGLTSPLINFVIACFAPGPDVPVWVDEIGGRPLTPGEVAFKVLIQL